MRAMGSLDGKVALVTGAGRGLGRAFALGLAREGAAVVALGRRPSPADDPETLEHTVALIEADGGTAHAIRCDVSDPGSVEQAFAAATAWGGGIDVLVNNAGMYHASDMLDTTVDQWRETLDSFLTGVFLCTQAVVPHMRARGGGAIVNLGSYAGTSTDASAFAYGVVRAGTDRFTVKAAAQLKDANIAVNALGPGFTDTERVRQVMGPDFDYTRTAAPEDSVPPLVFLALQRADGLTGQIVFTRDFGDAWGPNTT